MQPLSYDWDEAGNFETRQDLNQGLTETFIYDALERLWLALREIFADKVRSADDWKAAMNQFAVMYSERFTRVRA